jgi:tRNA nucleotidyltransferase (CCA-adding enzyme)
MVEKLAVDFSVLIKHGSGGQVSGTLLRNLQVGRNNAESHFSPHPSSRPNKNNNNKNKNNNNSIMFMFPALPVDPDKAEPIMRTTKMVELGKSRNTHSSETLELELHSDEQHLFETLRKTVKALEEGKINSGNCRKVQVRVAGGWVRDRVLGLQTHDVDIALDACTGVEFAYFVKEYITEFEHEKVGRIGVIAANPAQSKHLETATMKLYGIEVDFCNLRHETYAEDSRIPTSITGTPLEDSYRRDFTMNALYYNLHTLQVEDWTRHGLKDLLETRQVTTPLEAYQTFHDDPLRVLRAIRFAVRYHMQLSDDLQKACMHPQIHKELHSKVSRERVGKELEGMMSGKHANPIQALKLICNLKLAGSVFCLPPDDIILGTIGQGHLEPVPYRASTEEEFGHLRQVAWEEARECLRILPKLLETMKPPTNEGVTTWDSRLLYLAVVLLPYEHLQYVEKNKVKFVAEYIFREGIKFKNKDVQAMSTTIEQLDGMVQLLQRTPEATSCVRLKAGLLLRSTKDLWVNVLIVATVTLLRKKATSASVDWYERAKTWYHIIVLDLELEGCWKLKPLMNGKEIMQFLALDKGPLVGVYTQELIKWMLMNPEGTPEECKAFLKSSQIRRDFEEDQAAQHISKKMHL